ncbi:MAG: PA0069 family radical SAM protein [Pseudomonadales bacterium]|nr:PA0069 family radical SAM protein [Pseudomonadales bacterium]MCP5185670.1 PA0069 family radical SAM protein [Pseudomonadales bacterium]
MRGGVSGDASDGITSGVADGVAAGTKRCVVAIPGRGAVTNAASRYLPVRHIPVDDGWGVDPAEEARGLKTILKPDVTRQIITRNASPDVPFTQSINPYKGCEHGCVYCFARPTHAYLDLSPGLDFETRLFFKTNVRSRLETELSRPRYQPSPIALGTNTDPYQPVERQQRITRDILEVLLEARHPVTLVTKGQGVLRDLDLWAELARLGLAQVNISVTTLDRTLKHRLEPRTAEPGARLRTIRTLAAAGIPVGVMVAPVIPFINDEEMEAILAAAADAGASTAGYILLRLPLEVRELFQEWLDTHYPDRKARVISAMRASRGGDLYRAKFGERMRGTGPFAELFRRRFAIACNKHGLNKEPKTGLRTDLFRRPRGQQLLF